MRFAFIGRRLALMVPMLFGILTATFFLTRVIPGDPSYQIAGANATPSAIAQIRSHYGFDHSLLTQYWDYLQRVVLHFDLGTSFVTGNSVVSDLRQRVPSTLELIIGALVIAVAVGIPFGIFSAVRQGTRADRVTRGITFILLALPDFWLALVAIYFFFLRWKIAPAPTGQLGVGQSEINPITHAALLDGILRANISLIGTALAHAALPLLVLGLLISASIARLTRSTALGILQSDYVRYARSCGVGEPAVIRYVLRALLPPVLTLAGIIFTVLLGGAVLIETIFSWQGAAQYAANAIQRNDYSAVQGFVLFAGVTSIIVFLLVDIAHVVIDPRIRV